VDARTGKEIWRHDPDVDRSFGSHACCGPNNRGVAIYDGMVYVGVLDGRLIALDQKTGGKVWSVKTTEDDYQSITGAPRVVKGKVIIGNAGAEFGVRGYVTAYDAKTGKLAWRFYTIPGDPSKPVEHPELALALKTWNGEWWKMGGGGTVWDAFAYDPGADLLYVGTGDGGPCGAHSWQPMSYSPDTKLVYIPGTNAAFPFGPDPNFKFTRGRQNFAATFIPPPDAVRPPTPSGFLVAWDPATNAERWRVKYPSRPGETLVTGGNLVFESSPDGHLLAYSADKGEKLWDIAIGPGIATPVTWLIDGRQYVAVLAGRNGGRLFTFALDAKEPIPALPAPPTGRGRGVGRAPE
jgi:glucose dehydrogenase